MSPELKQFIKENKYLINENTKESWEKIYSNSIDYPMLIGKFTETMLGARIDPAKFLGYIPEFYLFESSIKEYIIPSNIDLICKYAFKECDQLKKIFIPDSVLFIEEKAFLYCYSLKEISLGNKLNGLDPFIFSNCDMLQELNYRGTKEEWRSIAKDENWAEDSSIQKIICIDGEITL